MIDLWRWLATTRHVIWRSCIYLVCDLVHGRVLVPILWFREESSWLQYSLSTCRRFEACACHHLRQAAVASFGNCRILQVHPILLR